MFFWRFFGAVIACVFATAGPAQALGVWQVTVTEVEQNTVDVRIRNAGPETAWALVQGGVLDPDLPEDVLRVQRLTASGYVPVAYIGPVVKRARPSATDYLTFESGAEITRRLHVTSLYDASETGEYRVQLAAHFLYRTTRPVSDLADLAVLPTHEQMLVSAPQDITLTVNAANARLIDPGFGACTVEQQADIHLAGEAAQRYVDTAVSDLSSLSAAQRSTSPRYAQWFGDYALERYASVEQNFRNIQKVMEQESLTFDCGCALTGVYAYVQVNDPYNIYLCPAFWQASTEGTDSRAGTLVHELSHFQVVAGTSDHVYGQSGAALLAASNPERATQNADSHEYFAENTPELDIASANEPPPAGAQITVLSADDSYSASLAAGERHYFTTTDVTRISLVSLTGDVDLTVYGDAEYATRLCASTNRGAELDHCAPAQVGSVYFDVRAVEDSSYRLNTETDSVGADLPVLIVGEVTRAALAEGENQTYRIDSGLAVRLAPSSGMGNLYVLNDPDDLNSVVCSATGSVGEAQCEINGDDATRFAHVVALTDMQYQIEALADAVSPQGGMSVPGAGLAGWGVMLLAFAGRWRRVVAWLAQVKRFPGRLVMAGVVSFLVSVTACSQPPVVQQSHNAATGPSRAGGLVASLEPSDKGDTWVHFSVRNDGSVTAVIPVWGTPFESPLLGDYFDVFQGKIELIYRGPMAKRALEGSPEIRLAPDEAMTVEIDLSAYYRLRPKHYTTFRFSALQYGGKTWLRQGVPLVASVGGLKFFYR